MAEVAFSSRSPEETERYAAQLAPTFQSGDLIVLTGPLGSGKTLFVAALARARGNTRIAVASPTYAMVHEYPGELPLFHFDLYRMNSAAELVELGWDDYRQRPGIMLVEWGEKFSANLPAQYYQISFERLDESTRRLSLRSVCRGRTS